MLGGPTFITLAMFFWQTRSEETAVLKCSGVPSILHGIVTSGSSDIGAARNVSCNKGYYMAFSKNNALPVAFCEKNGKWQLKMRCLKLTHYAIFNAFDEGNMQRLDYMLHQWPHEIDAYIVNTGLNRAAEHGHFDLLRFLYSNYRRLADINTRSEDRGYTPLISAAKANSSEIVRFLLECDADVHARSFKGASSALKYAAMHGNLDSVRYLVQRGAEVESIDAEGTTPLHQATSKNRSTEVVKFLLQNGADVNRTTEYGITALLFASRNVHFETVKLLLDNRANVRHSDITATNALHFAALRCRDDLLDLLLERGADVNAKNNAGHSALMMAILNNCPPDGTLKLLVEKWHADWRDVDNKGFTALMLAASKTDNVPTIKYLLGLDVTWRFDVNLQSKTNVNALLTAAYYGQTETCRLLLERGADLESRDNDGSTSLILAARRNHSETVRFLLLEGAQVNARTKLNWTSLMFAARWGHAEVTFILLQQRHLDVNSLDSSGRDNALTLACRYGHLDVAKLLLEQSSTLVTNLNKYGDTALIMVANDLRKLDDDRPANLAQLFHLLITVGKVDVNAKDAYGSTALHFAIRRNLTLGVMQVLVENGVDVNATSYFGDTPLAWAIQLNREDVVKLLIEAGADVNAPSPALGSTPLIEAVERSRVNIVKLLLRKGANVTATNDDSMTALHVASMAPPRGRQRSPDEMEILRMLSVGFEDEIDGDDDGDDGVAANHVQEEEEY